MWGGKPVTRQRVAQEYISWGIHRRSTCHSVPCRLDFVKRMEETRANIKQFCLGQAAGWGEQSGLILDLQRRAQMANLLVSRGRWPTPGGILWGGVE